MTKDYYSYRCKHRKACNIIIKIAKTVLIKLSENKENQNIIYTITSTEKKHLCLNNNNKKEVKIKGKKLKPDFSIIISNIEKPFLFHYNNIRNNNI